MIASTTSGRSFPSLAWYLEHGRSGHETERIAWTAERNLPTNEPLLAARIMQATAHESALIQQPVYHISISFDPTDRVTPEQMQRVADHVLTELGLAEHQALIVAHKDRAHPHVHVMVNRVHPETHRAWERWQDRPVIERALREEERALGLRQVEGQLYKFPERGAAVDLAAEQEAQAQLLQRAKEHLGEYRSARSWDDLHAHVEEHGLRLHRKGQGLVFSDGEHDVKASLVARDLSLARLEARFGAPYPGDEGRSTAIERGRLSPRVAELVEALDGVEYAERLRRESYRLTNELRLLEARRAILADYAKSVEHTDHELTRSLARVYREPERVRQRFDELARTSGESAALAALRERPEQLGRLHTVDEKRMLGLIIASVDRDARELAPLAARAAEELFKERARLYDSITEIQRSTEQNFASALALVYRDPVRARTAFETALTHAGADAAIKQLAEGPDAFGSPASATARAQTNGVVLSLQESAQLAASWARDVIAVREASNAALMQAYLTSAIERHQTRERELDRALGFQLDPRLMERHIANAVQHLAPHEFLELYRAVAAPQRAVVAKIKQKVRDVALGRDDDVELG